MRFDRARKSPAAEWWWTVNRPALFAIVFLAALGCVMVSSAGPAVASRFSDNEFYFLRRHLVFVVIGIGAMVGLSFLSEQNIRRIGIAGFAAAAALVLCTLLFSTPVNGARRWMSLAGFTIQPSEFMKPFFIVVTGWLLAKARTDARFPGYLVSAGLCALSAGLLMLQPDFGMTLVLLAVWAGQVFISGIPLWQGLLIPAAAVALAAGAYMHMEHVRARVHAFLGEAGYQETKALEAFQSGGLLGRGPGEGTVKSYLPDAHTDFIFAVIGEELGALAAALVTAMYAAVIIVSVRRLMHEKNLFVLLTGSGILLQFGLQAMINMAVAVRLAPTKGMTLPLISYGGSSMIAVCIGLGILLRLTRRRYGGGDAKEFSVLY